MPKNCEESYLTPFYRGDDHTLRFAFRVETTDEPIDLTGWSFFLTMKLNPNAPDSEADIRIDKLEARDAEVAAGNVDLKIPAADTRSLLPANYFIDVQAISPEGQTVTLFVGRQRVLADITRRAGL